MESHDLTTTHTHVQVKLLVLQGGVVSSAQLLNITCGMERKLTVGAAQSFLKVLVEEKWLSKVGVPCISCS